jgi:hypothetical protein
MFICWMNWVPWDDAIVVSAGKLRKLWDFLSELCSSLCERRPEKTVLRPALLPVQTAQFTQFFRQVWRHTVKIAQFNWECIASFTYLRKWHDATRNVNVTSTGTHVHRRLYKVTFTALWYAAATIHAWCWEQQIWGVHISRALWRRN